MSQFIRISKSNGYCKHMQVIQGLNGIGTKIYF